MSVVPILDLDARATAARYLPAARAMVRELHGDGTLTYGQAEQWAAGHAGQPAFQAAVDAARADVAAELDVLRARLAHLVNRAGQIDPADAARVAVFLHDLVLTLGSSRDATGG